MPRSSTIYSKKRAGKGDVPTKPPVPWRERLTLRITEVAELIGVNRDTVQKLIDDEDVVVRHIGRIPLIVTSSLIDWAEGNPTIEPNSKIRKDRIAPKHRAEAERLMNRIK